MASIYSSTSGVPTGNSYVDTLVWGGAWTPTLGLGATLNWTTSTSITGGLSWNSNEVTALTAALQSWAAVTNLTFISDSSRAYDLVYYKVTDAGMTSLTSGATGVLGFHDTPDGSNPKPLKGVFNAAAFDAAQGGNSANLASGADGYVTLVHEIGHGLGLAHPHDGGGSGEVFAGVSSWSDLGTNNRNQHIYTIMSYNVGWDQQPAPGSLLYGGAAGPMALDIAAAQAIYGVNTTTRSGTNEYSLPTSNASGTGWTSIWDAGGTDTISNAGSSQASTIDLREAPLTGANAGGYVSWIAGVAGGFTIANRVTIENATGGSGADTITGNDAANVLDGGAGADTMAGGKGNDTYRVDNASDVVTESISGTTGGTDTVIATVDFILGSNIENLTLSGSADLSGTGNTLDNTITGNAGANILYGGGGADTLKGGTGDDTYHVNVVLNGRSLKFRETVTEESDSGSDTLVLHTDTPLVLTTASTLQLVANVENIDISATGTALLNIAGNSIVNTLTGNDGANELDGGAGADTLIGGDGDDVYIVDDASDNVVETNSAAAGGTDTVKSGTYSYTLAANVENLVLATSAAVNGTGNTLDNAITGNASNNTLDGGAGNDTLDGSAGNDTLIGGAGNDIYYVDSRQDVIVELADEGTDEVRSSVSYTLAAHFENLTLTGAGVINGTGNSLNNTITGNTLSNVLDGGTGADTLIGGRGSDTYVINSIDDIASETEGGTLGGTDLVTSSVTYALGANIENLTLTGTTAINGTGNELGNTLVGNSAANTLDGGDGVDILRGGGGDDIYYVDVIQSLRIVRLEDVIVEAKSSGTDTIMARTDTPLVLTSAATLVVPVEIENFDISGTGTTLLNVTGSADANRITGNAVANTLDGGRGIDTLIGGAGDDTYLVDVNTDIVTELTGEGTDTVKSSAYSFDLSANVENLILTGSRALYGTGNELDNVITGNASGNTLSGGLGNDTLYGLSGNDTLAGGAGDDQIYGGLGKDTLTGDAGADFFIFNTRPGTLTNTDRITDFTIGDDKLVLDDTIFTVLASLGAVNTENLVFGTKALDADDYLVYNNGRLTYDADGSGVRQGIEFATLVGAPAITYSDFMVI